MEFVDMYLHHSHVARGDRIDILVHPNWATELENAAGPVAALATGYKSPPVSGARPLYIVSSVVDV